MDQGIYQILKDDENWLNIVINNEFKVVSVDELFLSLIPCPESEIAGMSFLDFIPKLYRSKVRSQLNSLSLNSPIVRYEHELVGLNGSAFWVSWMAVRSSDEVGAPHFIIIGQLKENQNILERILMVQRDIAVAMNSDEGEIHLDKLLLDNLLNLPYVSMAAFYELDPADNSLNLKNQVGMNPTLASGMQEFTNYSSFFKVAIKGSPYYFDLEDSISRGMKRLESAGIRGGGILPITIERSIKYVVAIFSNRLAIFPKAVNTGVETIIKHVTPLFARQIRLSQRHQYQVNLKGLFDCITDHIFIINMQGRVVKVNRAVELLYGKSSEELKGTSLLDYHPAKYRAQALNILSDVLNNNANTYSIPLQLPDGSRIEVETKATIGEWDGESAVIAVSRDLTEGLRMKTQIFQGENRLELALVSGNLGMWEWDLKKGAIVFESNWSDMPGEAFVDEQVISKNLVNSQVRKSVYRSEKVWAQLIHPEDREQVQNRFKSLLDGSQALFAAEYRVLRADGSWRWVIDTGRVVSHDDEDFPLVAVGVQTDISELKISQEKLRILSITDYQTDVYNKRYLFDRMDQILQKSIRLKKPCAIVLFDLDNFKQVNDSFGHLVGDYALKEFATVLKMNMRPYDLVGRFGGDEFLVILDGASNRKARLVLERIKEKVENLCLSHNGQSLSIEFSCGVANSKEFKKYITRDAVIQLADERMYKAKETPGSHFVTH